MKSSAVAVGILSCLLAAATVVSAQLGDVARKEAERRKTVKSTGKTYTNDTLKPAPPPSSVPASTAAEPSSDAAAETPSSSSSTESAEKPAAAARVSDDPAERKKEEAQWRERMKNAREALERAKSFADALQSKINALNAEFVNRDDPAQRNRVAAERDKSLAEMAQLKKEIEQHNKAIAAIQDEARRAGVPSGWLR